MIFGHVNFDSFSFIKFMTFVVVWFLENRGNQLNCWRMAPFLLFFLNYVYSRCINKIRIGEIWILGCACNNVVELI